jgi:hypothetical protein
MKKFFTGILILVPILMFSQKWEYKYYGNSFDGFVRISAIQNFENTLAIVNSSDSLNIVNGAGQGIKNGIDKLSIRLLIKGNSNPQRVLMAFDQEQKYYIANFTTDGNLIFIENAISADFNFFLPAVKIIDLLQTKKVVHFRLFSESSHLDYSFSLNGSGDVIKKTFQCTSCKFKGNWSDAVMELIVFISLFTEVNENENYSSLSTACLDYLKIKHGEFYFTQVSSIETEKNDDFPVLVFKNNQGYTLDRIYKESYLKNYYHLSGNPKRKNGDLVKDIETLEIYFDAFSKYTTLVKDKNLSFKAFCELKKSDLPPFYKALKQNKDFLDFVRKDESVYYLYEPDDYKFEVFAEAWGEETDEK